jgi:hypothetical protein
MLRHIPRGHFSMTLCHCFHLDCQDFKKITWGLKRWLVDGGQLQGLYQKNNINRLESGAESNFISEYVQFLWLRQNKHFKFKSFGYCEKISKNENLQDYFGWLGWPEPSSQAKLAKYWSPLYIIWICKGCNQRTLTSKEKSVIWERMRSVEYVYIWSTTGNLLQRWEEDT